MSTVSALAYQVTRLTKSSSLYCHFNCFHCFLPFLPITYSPAVAKAAQYKTVFYYVYHIAVPHHYSGYSILHVIELSPLKYFSTIISINLIKCLRTVFVQVSLKSRTHHADTHARAHARLHILQKPIDYYWQNWHVPYTVDDYYLLPMRLSTHFIQIHNTHCTTLIYLLGNHWRGEFCCCHHHRFERNVAEIDVSGIMFLQLSNRPEKLNSNAKLIIPDERKHFPVRHPFSRLQILRSPRLSQVID